MFKYAEILKGNNLVYAEILNANQTSMYCTGLSHVDISEASPLFLTDDNMLFSKDGTRLLRQLTDDKEDYTIPPTVTAIGQGCFRFLNTLQRLTIPANVTSISHYVLYGCKNLTDVYCLAVTPIRLGNYVFALTDLSTVTLHVPHGCRYAYSVSTGWSQFGTIVDDLSTHSPGTSEKDETTGICDATQVGDKSRRVNGG